MTPELLTILDKDGKAPKSKDPNLPADELKKLYRLMCATRALDDRGLALQRQGRIGFYLQSTGQEASHLGAAYALKDSDWLFPAYRQPGILLLHVAAACTSDDEQADGSAATDRPATSSPATDPPDRCISGICWAHWQTGSICRMSMTAIFLSPIGMP